MREAYVYLWIKIYRWISERYASHRRPGLCSISGIDRSSYGHQYFLGYSVRSTSDRYAGSGKNPLFHSALLMTSRSNQLKAFGDSKPPSLQHRWLKFKTLLPLYLSAIKQALESQRPLAVIYAKNNLHQRLRTACFLSEFCVYNDQYFRLLKKRMRQCGGP